VEPQFGYHPLLTLNAEVERAMYGTSDANDGIAAQVYGDIDNTPKAVALFGLGALATLIALKALGFRFAIGVGT
jgi:hypothetical protein